MSDIKLKSFRVSLNEFGKDRGHYRCSAEFKHGENNFLINLPNEIGSALVSVCKDEIQKASSSAFESLTLAINGDKDE